jgi:hypothetical protein
MTLAKSREAVLGVLITYIYIMDMKFGIFNWI